MLLFSILSLAGPRAEQEELDAKRPCILPLMRTCGVELVCAYWDVCICALYVGAYLFVLQASWYKITFVKDPILGTVSQEGVSADFTRMYVPIADPVALPLLMDTFQR